MQPIFQKVVAGFFLSLGLPPIPGVETALGITNEIVVSVALSSTIILEGVRWKDEFYLKKLRKKVIRLIGEFFWPAKHF